MRILVIVLVILTLVGCQQTDDYNETLNIPSTENLEKEETSSVVEMNEQLDSDQTEIETDQGVEENQQQMPELEPLTIEQSLYLEALDNLDKDLKGIHLLHEEDIFTKNTLPNSNENSYEVANLIDFDMATAWVEGYENDGVGATIDYTVYTGDNRFNTVDVVTGYCKSEDTFMTNNRPSKLLVSVNGENVCILNLRDSMDLQRFFIGNQYYEGPLQVSFKVLDIYKGTVYNDTCISELHVGYYKDEASSSILYEQGVYSFYALVDEVPYTNNFILTTDSLQVLIEATVPLDKTQSIIINRYIDFNNKPTEMEATSIEWVDDNTVLFQFNGLEDGTYFLELKQDPKDIKGHEIYPAKYSHKYYGPVLSFKTGNQNSIKTIDLNTKKIATMEGVEFGNIRYKPSQMDFESNSLLYYFVTDAVAYEHVFERPVINYSGLGWHYLSEDKFGHDFENQSLLKLNDLYMLHRKEVYTLDGAYVKSLALEGFVVGVVYDSKSGYMYTLSGEHKKPMVLSVFDDEFEQIIHQIELNVAFDAEAYADRIYGLDTPMIWTDDSHLVFDGIIDEVRVIMAVDVNDYTSEVIAAYAGIVDVIDDNLLIQRWDREVLYKSTVKDVIDIDGHMVDGYEWLPIDTIIEVMSTETHYVYVEYDGRNAIYTLNIRERSNGQTDSYEYGEGFGLLGVNDNVLYINVVD